MIQTSSRICFHCTTSRELVININEWGGSVDQHGEEYSARKGLKNLGCKYFNANESCTYEKYALACTSLFHCQ